ncbi:MAG: prepilin-type N-terminal cleavage/methylation domain-containing protein [bacterium]|nr:prepilin-type N-terminal cleavage/methylation domain-containing protein [bacterium]
MVGLRLKASSLIEIIVAMVIISIISSIAILIYLNTLNSLDNSKQLNLDTKVKFYVNKVASTEPLEDFTLVDEEGDKVLVTIEEHDVLNNLFVVKGEITDSLDYQRSQFQRLKYLVQ